ncbi:hypothetical protein B0H14DRAFT_2574993 [Mycena olivaceomarginata]|nr:hypothetical protein B0H14DRAFT_2574993 [Mycena olivaceomarginata]
MALANARSDFDPALPMTQELRFNLTNCAPREALRWTSVLPEYEGPRRHLRHGVPSGGQARRLSFGVIAGDWDCRLFHESPRRAVQTSVRTIFTEFWAPHSDEIRTCRDGAATRMSIRPREAELIAPAKPRRTSALNGYEISVYHISTKIGMRGTFTACVDLYGLSQGRRCQYHSSHKLKTRLAEFRGGKNTTGPRGN